MLVLGIDEAGRGPVIGDMFIVGLVVDEGSLSHLRSLGVKDSKSLTPKAREDLLTDIVAYARFIVVTRVTPDEIDRVSLNALFRDRVKRLLVMVKNKVGCVDRVVIDLAGSEGDLRSFLSRLCPNTSLIAEYKADAKYVEVSAASIVAKVLRDKHIKRLSAIYGDLGSGYPSDPKTIKWLREWYRRHGSLPPIVRKKWVTVRKVLRLRQRSLDEFLR